jgi:hypothetical protein
VRYSRDIFLTISITRHNLYTTNSRFLQTSKLFTWS